MLVDTVVLHARRILSYIIIREVVGIDVVGLENPVRLVQRALSLGQDSHGDGLQFLAGVYGMGGVGKTTLALAVYDAAAVDYHGRRIYLTIGAECKSDSDLHEKRCSLLQQLSGDACHASASLNASEGRLNLRTALAHSGPLLLVLDDLWTHDQLLWLLGCEDSEDLLEGMANLYPGSRVLLTSRNRRIVTVEGYEAGVIYLQELDDRYSEQLLCKTAFASSVPPPKFTAAHMEQALAICGGLPLALQFLGRQLKAKPTQWQVHPWAHTSIMRLML